jgi:shikimate dehydrogenase
VGGAAGDASPWPEKIPLPDRAYIYDLVYNPAETRLVQSARLAGLHAANGLGMLVHQAALSFERWTGQSAPLQAMAEAAAAAL